MLSDPLILCHSLLLLPSIFPSNSLFQWVGSLYQVAKVLELRHQHQSFQTIFRVNISFRIDRFELPEVQGTLKSLLQHNSKASILQSSVFFTVQLSHPYMTTGKTITLTTRTFAGKVMSLLFNMLSRFIIAFLPRSKHLLISWLQSPSAVILEPKKRKSVTTSTFPPSICHEVMEPDAMILLFWMLSFKPGFLLASFTFIKRLFSSSSLSAIRVTYAYVICISKVTDISPNNLDLACNSSSTVFHIINSVYKLYKQAGWQYTALMYFFLNLEPVSCSMSISNCCFLTHIQVSQETGEVVWYSHLLKNFPQLVVVHTVKGFSVDNESEIDVFPGLPWFLHDPMNVGNLIYG